MSVSIYQVAAPAFQQTLTALSAILGKAAAHARENGSDAAELVEARLAPDMFALARQVQIATDHAKGAMARLSGREVPKFPDDETTIEALQERIAKVLEFVNSVEVAELDGAEEREITLTVAKEELKLPALRYLVNFALPNFYFHATTAYDILRHKGVPLGKRDFIGAA